MDVLFNSSFASTSELCFWCVSCCLVEIQLLIHGWNVNKMEDSAMSGVTLWLWWAGLKLEKEKQRSIIYSFPPPVLFISFPLTPSFHFLRALSRSTSVVSVAPWWALSACFWTGLLTLPVLHLTGVPGSRGSVPGIGCALGMSQGKSHQTSPGYMTSWLFESAWFCSFFLFTRALKFTYYIGLWRTLLWPR